MSEADLLKELQALKEELEITDKLLESRNEVLRAIPACPVHGDQCIPHALDWIETKKTAVIDSGEEFEQMGNTVKQAGLYVLDQVKSQLSQADCGKLFELGQACGALGAMINGNADDEVILKYIIRVLGTAFAAGIKIDSAIKFM